MGAEVVKCCSLGISDCNTAVRNNSLEALKLLHERGCPWDRRTSAVARGELLEWAKDHGCPASRRMPARRRA